MDGDAGMETSCTSEFHDGINGIHITTGPTADTFVVRSLDASLVR
jgi:hypothetical protein